MIYWRLLQESIRFAIHALVVNKLRTLLSLLGITIGIYAIIMIYSVVDSLEYTVRKSVAGLGEKVVYVQKWNWGPEEGSETYAWWKYFNRPEPSYKEYKALESKVPSAEHIAFTYSKPATLRYFNNQASNTPIIAVTHNYLDIWDYVLQDGRYFSELESQSGRPVCVLGFAVADGLFPNEDPIGKEVRALGRKFKVIGIFESQGDDLFGNSTDENVYIPVEYARKIFPDNVSGSAILAKAKTETGIAPMIDELRATLRGLRRLKPGDADSFSFNRMSMVTQALDGVFLIIKLAGIVIGGFSILVGGFGIANIMFVSVRERTSQIGIQKALGARNNFILLQFLVESVALCLIGGLIGLILVYLSLLVASNLIDFYIFLSVQNIIRAIVISVVIGLISGIFPAYFASQMQPVDAIRSGQ